MQVQRHGHARAVAARVKNDPASFRLFSDIVNAPNFRERLEAALADPQGREAMAILRQLESVLDAVAAPVPYSAMGRNVDVTKLMNMWRAFGWPSAFCTISPDDVHGPLCLRLTVGTVRPGEFPETDDGFMGALQEGQETFQVDLHIRNRDLYRRLAANPVAAAEAYHRCSPYLVFFSVDFHALELKL